MSRHLRARLMAVAVRGCFMDGGEPAAGGGETKPAPVAPASAISSAQPTPEQAAAQTLADQRAFLIENTSDGEKGLEGKTPEQIAALHGALIKKMDEEKAIAEAAKARQPTVDEQKKYLTDKGTKKEDLDKLSEADLRKQFDAAKKADADKPIVYKDFNFPEGVKPDDKMLTGFKGIMAKAKVPQEVAQELIDLYGSQLQELAKAPYALWEKTQNEWRDGMKADKEIGGEKLDENLGVMAQLIDSIAEDQKEATLIRQALDLTGAGNHPMIGKLLFRVGKLLLEGGAVGGERPASPNPKNPAEVLYPKQGEVQQGNARAG